MQSALLGRLAVEEMNYMSTQDEVGILEVQKDPDMDSDAFSYRILILKLRQTLRLLSVMPFSNQRSFLESLNTYTLSAQLKFNEVDLDLLEQHGSQVSS